MNSLKFIPINILIISLGTSVALAQAPAANKASNKIEQSAETSADAVKGPLIDVLDFKDADILAALTQIEEKSGIIISPDPNIQGKVTLSLRAISVWDALKIILDANDLAYYQQGDVIKVTPAAAFAKQYGYSFDAKTRATIAHLNFAEPSYVQARLNPLRSPLGRIITTPDPKTLVILDDPKIIQSMLLLLKDLDVPLETKVFQLRYAIAQEVAGKVKDVLSRNIGQVNFDDRTNQVVVIDKPDNILKANELIVQMDQQRQITIDTEVIVINLNEEHNNGIDWEAIVSDYMSLESVGEKTPNNTPSKKISFGTLSHEDYKILIDALEVVGEMKSYPTPSAVILDNDRSYLELSIQESDVKMVVVSQAPKTGDSPLTDEKKIGFYVTPEIHVDGTVSLKIEPVIKDIDGDVQPTLKTDEMTVIGGIFTENKQELTNKFPVLGDIPLLGFVFRSQSFNLRKTEYVVFLKPQVVADKSKSK